MDSLSLRERLHEYIESADEQHLSALYILVGDKIPEHKDEIYTEEVMNMLIKEEKAIGRAFRGRIPQKKA